MRIEINTDHEPWKTMIANGERAMREYLSTPEGFAALKESSQALRDKIDSDIIDTIIRADG